MTKVFKYGFDYKEMSYGWYKKDLYRLPSVIGLRTYSFRKLPLISIGNKKGYRIMQDPKTIEQLQQLTERIDYVYTVNGKNSDDTPF